MKVSDNAINLCAKWEGFFDKAYLCPAKIPTIGYGTTKYPNGQKVKLGDKITQPEAKKLLQLQLQEHASTIDTYVKVKLTQNQYDALASFQYNLGKHILKGSKLLEYINTKQWDKASEQMLKYCNANGKFLQGLYNRRKEEVALFMKDLGKGCEDEMEFTSPTLRNYYNDTITDKKVQKVIIENAVKQGIINKSWLTKKDIEIGDIITISLMVANKINN